VRDTERITLAHGSGGAVMQDFIRNVLFQYLDSPELREMDDAAELAVRTGRLAFSTDSFVVKPVFFPGGDIGSLAVSGTVNDVLMKGARPLYLSLGLIIEEGFPMSAFRRILESIRETSERAGVRVVTGDTKVVASGEIDGICINTSGIGEILPKVRIGGARARSGDTVIVSGSIGRHGIAVMTERNGLKIEGDITSDAAPLNDVVLPLLERFGDAVHVLRDPTRGGVAAALNEIALAGSVSILADESAFPVSNEVNAVCEILGFDPFYLPCEGRFITVVEGSAADEILSFLHDTGECREAVVIGEVTDSRPGEVVLMTISGGRRILDMPAGELFPRIC